MTTGVDLSSFHAIFFEECNENLAILETELLKLDANPDLEVLNTIFRAAHSIKGGGATFGFPEISDFTHGMETILDEMRNRNLETSHEVVEVLLASLDGLRGMIRCSIENKPLDTESIHALQDRQNTIVQNIPVRSKGKNESSAQPVVTDNDEEVELMEWAIHFYPHRDLFFTGNDPLRLIRELEAMGEVSVEVVTDQMPTYNELDPQLCYLGWNIRLKGEVDGQKLDEVFAWVEDECELDIRNISHSLLDADVDTNTELQRAADVVAATGRRKSDKMQTAGRDSKSIRVGVDKVDALVNLIGELVITQSILSRACEDLDPAQSEKIFSSLAQLERNTRDLQEQTMSIRMLPIDFAYQRLPRIVHDLSLSLGKKVELTFSGENIELDKTVLEKIGDPLVHLVRNALDHGIESPDDRRQAGKAETGQVYIDAYHQGRNIVVEITDDGAGLNYEKILKKARDKKLVDESLEMSDEQLSQLIFLPGLSTTDLISDISGRGVGMDVVKKNIEELGGAIEVNSTLGEGCKFKIRLPLTLAILDGQMIRIEDQIYIIPLQSIVESIQIQNQNLYRVAGATEVYHYRGSYIPVIRLGKVLGLADDDWVEEKEDVVVESLHNGLLVIIDVNGENVGLCVDDIVGQQQVVIKSLEKNYRHVRGLAGATVLGDGSVAMIIDVYDISRNHLGQEKTNTPMSFELTEKPLPLH
jgi:two-component system chemotaxis sensor kinase CheA